MGGASEAAGGAHTTILASIVAAGLVTFGIGGVASKGDTLGAVFTDGVFCMDAALTAGTYIEASSAFIGVGKEAVPVNVYFLTAGHP